MNLIPKGCVAIHFTSVFAACLRFNVLVEAAFADLSGRPLFNLPGTTAQAVKFWSVELKAWHSFDFPDISSPRGPPISLQPAPAPPKAKNYTFLSPNTNNAKCVAIRFNNLDLNGRFIVTAECHNNSPRRIELPWWRSLLDFWNALRNAGWQLSPLATRSRRPRWIHKRVYNRYSLRSFTPYPVNVFSRGSIQSFLIWRNCRCLFLQQVIDIVLSWSRNAVGNYSHMISVNA